MSDIREMLIDCLEKLGLTHAGREDDSRRWSHSDLATDLAPYLIKAIQAAVVEEREACAKLADSYGYAELANDIRKRENTA